METPARESGLISGVYIKGQSKSRWTVRDHRGRDIVLRKIVWDKIAVLKEHVRGNAASFEKDMKTALTKPTLCHLLPATMESAPRWAYYACSSDANNQGMLVLVVVDRRPDMPFDVVVSARLEDAPHRAAYQTGALEVGESPVPGSRPCGPRGHGPGSVNQQILAKLEEELS